MPLALADEALESGASIRIEEVLQLIEDEPLAGEPQIPEISARRVLPEEFRELAAEVRLLLAELQEVAERQVAQRVCATDNSPTISY